MTAFVLCTADSVLRFPEWFVQFCHIDLQSACIEVAETKVLPALSVGLGNIATHVSLTENRQRPTTLETWYDCSMVAVTTDRIIMMCIQQGILPSHGGTSSMELQHSATVSDSAVTRQLTSTTNSNVKQTSPYLD